MQILIKAVFIGSICLLLCSFSSCNQKPQDSQEVISLREKAKSLEQQVADLTFKVQEISVLRAQVKSLQDEMVQQKAAALLATKATSPEISEFLRTSRRMISAIGTGVNLDDFGKRLVEVTASAEEALPKISDQAQKNRIVDFLYALKDSYDLWRYKIVSGEDRMQIEMISGSYAYPANFPKDLGDRWNSNFVDLVKRYRLNEKNKDDITPPIREAVGNGGYKPQLFFDFGLQHIFEYATKTFREIEKSENLEN